uniref:Sushi domain-containing protein n=1 Tax=Oryzias sinensis TaxID=183150 RepID=A0A8C7YQN0_9TELE
MEVVLNASGLRKLRSLLLIHLFAVNAAADCLTPPTTQLDTDLSAESRLVDEYREGVQLQLECVSGYLRKSGTGITTCNSGNWTKSDLICTKKDCGPPPDQPHMKFNLSQGTLFGDAVQVLCDKGYLLSGVTFKQCLSFGWFGRASCFGEPLQVNFFNICTFLSFSVIFKHVTISNLYLFLFFLQIYIYIYKCFSLVFVAVVCKTPPEVANGSSSWRGPKNPKYGETIQYSCEEGYTLFGNSTITCDENGGYTPGPPECKNVPGINTNKESVSVPVIISLTAVFLVIILVISFLYMFRQKKKGSYDTGEDLKPELLQFQNL